MENKELNKIVNFLFEVGTMKKLPRMHQQALLSQDLSDNIATHSYRVSIIAWFLAKMEDTDPYKTTLMALFHDLDETRSGDHNYIHKKYVKIFEKEILKDQLENLPFNDLIKTSLEYENRQSKEAIVAKDADLIDQIILLKEYSHQGNKEADIWLHAKGKETQNIQIKNLKTESGKKLGKAILEGNVSEWWENIWTPNRREN
ncbi:MAG: HD domain-containing protein [Nanoarchaeota archaeon]